MPETSPFVISRVFQAPRALLFEVVTQPQHLAQWMSPAGFKTIHAAMDFQVGGTYHYGLEGPNGMQMWGKQTYLEIVPNEKIVYIQAFSDPEGNLTRHPMSATWPLEMHVTATFEDAGPNLTRYTISWHPHNSDDAGHATFDSARPNMSQGFEGTYAKLDAYLAEIQA